MIIKNLTKLTLLTKKAHLAKSFKDQLLGMTQYKTPQAMIFQTRFGIHTFGMRYPIDVIILNNKQQVFALKSNIKPNHVFLWNPLFNTVIELPKGTIEKTKTELGDFIDIS